MNRIMDRGFRSLCVGVGIWLAAGGGALASGSGSIVLTGPAVPKNVIAVSVPAEVLAFEIHLQSGDEDWENRLREIEAIRSQLAQSAAKQGLRLLTRQAMALNQQSYAKFSAVSSTYSNPDLAVRANLLLVADLDAKSDLVALVRKMRLVLNSLPRPRGVTMALGEGRLGLEDPEKLRPQLLAKVREHVDLTVRALGTEEVTVTGLDEPVQARQADERSVEVSLPVRMTYGRKAKG